MVGRLPPLPLALPDLAEVEGLGLVDTGGVDLVKLLLDPLKLLEGEVGLEGLVEQLPVEE